MAAGVWSVPEIVEEASDLVDGCSIFCRPRSPLLAIDGTQVAVLISPFVPDPDFVFLQVADVCITHQKPEELVDDGAEVELLGGEAGKSLTEVVAGLPSEDGERTSTGTVGALFAVFEHIAEQVQVLPHGNFLPANGGKDAQIRPGISGECGQL